MFLVIFVTLALVISVTLAGTVRNSLAANITWENSYNYMATRTAIYKNHAFLAYRYGESISDTAFFTRMGLEGNEHEQHPFPNWAPHESDPCSIFRDVIDMFVDSKGLLWILDTGEVDVKRPCSQKIIAFNPTTGEVETKIDLTNSGEGPGYLKFSSLVVSYNRKGHPVVYVSSCGDRKILIRGHSCYHTIHLPDSPVLDESSYSVTLNLVRKDTNRILLINDERREKMFYLRLEDVESCSKPLDHLLHTLGPNNKVIIGNNELSTVYCREKSNRSVVYKYDALAATRYVTVAYVGNPISWVHHVVPDYKRGGVRLLQTEPKPGQNSKDSFPIITHSLIHLSNSLPAYITHTTSLSYFEHRASHHSLTRKGETQN